MTDSTETPHPWSELKTLQQEIKWANEMLDRYGAPRKYYNPYEHGEFDLNLAGRISVWLDPKNEGGWTVNNPEVQKLLDRSRDGK